MISPSPDVHLPDQSRTACLVRSRFLCRHDGRGVCRPRLIENRKTHRSLNCDRAVGYGVTCGTARFAQVAWPRRLAASAQVSLSTRSRRAYPPQRWMCSSARCGAECSGGDLRMRWGLRVEAHQAALGCDALAGDEDPAAAEDASKCDGAHNQEFELDREQRRGANGR